MTITSRYDADTGRWNAYDDNPAEATDYVAKSLYDANTLLTAVTDDTPAALAVAASRFVGRKATGNIDALTAAQAKTILGYTAPDVAYDHTVSGLTATDVKAALDEIVARLVVLETP